MDALTQYEDKMQKIALILEALTVWVEDMGGISPDAVTKTHVDHLDEVLRGCLLYTSPSPRDRTRSRMPSSA